MDHSAHRQPAGDDDLCEAPEGCRAGRTRGTEVTGAMGKDLRGAEVGIGDSRIVACLPAGLRLGPCKTTAVQGYKCCFW